MNRFLLSTAALVSFVATQGAWAASQTATIASSATVSTVCSLGTSPMTFGEVSLSGVTNGTASVGVTCTGGGSYTIGLDTGLNNIAAQRFLKSGTNTLAYGLFQDSSYGTVWTNAGAGLVSGTGNAALQTLTVYGQIPGSQALVSGNGTAYGDIVTVTLTY
jgi:spore coat protein U-like protein